MKDHKRVRDLNIDDMHVGGKVQSMLDKRTAVIVELNRHPGYGEIVLEWPDGRRVRNHLRSVSQAVYLG